MLPKRSTPVGQNLESESTHSQLSVAIFRALRNRLGAQKSLMYFQTCQKGVNPCIPPPGLVKRVIYEVESRSGYPRIGHSARF